MTEVQVPAALMLDENLSPKTKMVWIACAMTKGGPAADPRELAEVAGVIKETIPKAIARLEGGGWFAAGGSGGTAQAVPACSIPNGLLEECRRSPQAVLLYGYLQLLPGFRPAKGWFTYQDLTALAPISREVARKAVSVLSDKGWLVYWQEYRKGPYLCRLCNPVMDRASRMLMRVADRLDAAPHFGRAVLREYLSVLIDSEFYEDGAEPAFLYDEHFDEILSFDRYYEDECIGFQLDVPIDPDRIGARKRAWQRKRIVELCRANDAVALLVSPADLCRSGLLRLIAGRLPLRKLKGLEQVLEYLESACDDFRESLKEREAVLR